MNELKFKPGQHVRYNFATTTGSHRHGKGVVQSVIPTNPHHAQAYYVATAKGLLKFIFETELKSVEVTIP